MAKSKLPLSDDEFDRQFAAATKRGRERLRTQPTVKAAKWHKTQGLQLELSNGVRLCVPRSALPELRRATPRQLETIRVLGPGTALCWPDIDEQIGIDELLTDVLGSSHRQTLTGRKLRDEEERPRLRRVVERGD